MSREDTQLKFRVPDGLKARLNEAATANRRSLNAEITARLEASFGNGRPAPVLSKAAAKAALERDEEDDWRADIERRLAKLESGK